MPPTHITNKSSRARAPHPNPFRDSLCSSQVHSRKLACAKIHGNVLVSAGLPCNSVKVTSLPGLDPLHVLYRGATMKHVTHLAVFGNLVAAAGTETIHVWNLEVLEGMGAGSTGGDGERGLGGDAVAVKADKKKRNSFGLKEGLEAIGASSSLIKGTRSFYKLPTPEGLENVHLCQSDRAQVDEEGRKIFQVVVVGGGRVRGWEWDGKGGRGVLDEVL